MPMTSGRKMGTPLMPEPKDTDRQHRYLLVIGVERVGEEPLPPVAKTTEVIEAALEGMDMMKDDNGMTWRISYVSHV